MVLLPSQGFLCVTQSCFPGKPLISSRGDCALLSRGANERPREAVGLPASGQRVPFDGASPRVPRGLPKGRAGRSGMACRALQSLLARPRVLICVPVPLWKEGTWGDPILDSKGQKKRFLAEM